jgi:glycolate oxidase iron-sulfur subunit
VLLGDELDSPRGRISLIKHMLENNLPADAQTVRHVDRCLSCLSCMSTCPSGVNYMHLVDHARVHIEQTYRRPRRERWLRALLAFVLPRPRVLRAALRLARLARPLRSGLAGTLRALLDLAPDRVPPAAATDRPQVFPAIGRRRARVALLNGCAQQVLLPQVNEATVRLLTRHGCEVVVAPGGGCCGALTHHLGKDARRYMQANIDAWDRELTRSGLDAIVINASGCGTTVKDYGFLFRDVPGYQAKAQRVSAIARDVTEWLSERGLNPPTIATGQRVAYHSACSLQHGQQVHAQPTDLLRAAGFEVVAIPESHLCCGSAGTYNLLQPEIAMQLRARKLSHIDSVHPQIIASGNVGCITQIAAGTALPVLHTVELLDWATGGPRPPILRP